MSSELPKCETKFDVKGDLKAYIEGRYIVAKTVVEGKIGTCSLSQGCSWTLDTEVKTQFGKTDLAARAGVDLRAQGDGSIVLE